MVQCRFLMCRPTHFAVEYSINPWMDPSTPVNVSVAITQWSALRDTYLSLGHTVDEVEPVPGLPDMVFAANGGTVIDGRAYGAQFRFPERAGEGPAYLDWLSRAGFRTHEAKWVNEGEGDLLLAGRYLLAGTGFRTDQAAHAEAQEIFGRPVISLQLVDPRYYHLDTALMVLRRSHSGSESATNGNGRRSGVGNASAGNGSAGGGEDNIAYLPEAFSESSRRVLAQLFPDAVIASAEDAEAFGLNAVCDGRHVVMTEKATGLAQQLTERGFVPVPVDVSELLKAGGGPKCCTLVLRDG